MSGLGILMFVGIAVIGVVGAIIAHQQAKKRTEALSRLAKRLGVEFWPDRDSRHDDEFSHYEIFRRGQSRYAYNTLQGSLTLRDVSCWFRAGDFHYKVTSGSGKDRRTTTHHFSYCIVQLPWASVPDLLIRPEGMFDKLKGAFGFDDIDFESAEFSRRFYVASPDKRFAYDVIDARMMEFLMQRPPPGVDIEYGRCCVSDGKRRWEPQEFENIFRWLQAFTEKWPRHVVDSLTPRASGRLR